jgi:hypothetical protein
MVSVPTANGFESTITGYATGDSSSVISGSVSYTGDATTATNAGTYTLTSVVSDLSASNYTFAVGADSTLTINKATLTYTADAKTKVYDSQPFTAFTSTITGYQGTDTVAVVSGAVGYTGAATTATTYSATAYTITPDVSALSAGNYVFASANGGLTITKAVLTVTPDAKTKSYDGKVYTNVATVSPVPSVMKQSGLPEPVNKNELFVLDKPDMEMFNGFSDHLKTKIQASPEWQQLNSKSKTVDDIAPKVASFDEDDSDIPF